MFEKAAMNGMDWGYLDKSKKKRRQKNETAKLKGVNWIREIKNIYEKICLQLF